MVNLELLKNRIFQHTQIIRESDLMKLGIIQMPVVDDKKTNMEVATGYIADCAKQKADIVILPEMFICPYENSAFIAYAEPAEEGIYTALSEAAKKSGVILVGGSIPEAQDGKIYNTSFVFDNSGKEIAMCRKSHLFDIDVKGGQRFKESDTFTPGNDIVVFEACGTKIGLCICFDMRFPELSRAMALQGAEVIIAPAAFNMTTGPAHWSMLFRQRAVDNQLYTVGVSPARDESASYVAFGNSIVASPWGDVCCQLSEKAEAVVVDIDLDKIKSIRQQLPLMSARRRDMYTLKWE